MNRNLFLRILNGVTENDNYFKQTRNCAGKLGHSGLQKVTAALRQLAYGITPDAFDEYCRVGESVAKDCLDHFCEFVIDIYGDEYLRRPTQEDVNELYKVAEERGFPGMLGSLNCMHCEWKNCPTAWHGQFRGKGGKPTLVLEAVATKDLCIWHSFFGSPGSLNDINIHIYKQNDEEKINQ